MFNKGHRKTYDFTKDVTVRAFGDDIKNDDITMHKANDEQKFREFKSNT